MQVVLSIKSQVFIFPLQVLKSIFCHINESCCAMRSAIKVSEKFLNSTKKNAI